MLFALTVVVLLLFVGLAIDAGSIYITYGELKRAVDASAVSAANNFKRGASLDQMKQAAMEILALHNVDNTTIDVHICDEDGDGVKDAGLATEVPEFYQRCPTTDPAGTGDTPRKLVWIEAKEDAPTYFMTLLGFTKFPLHTNAIAEAAQVDVVVVFDVSESMGLLSPNYAIDEFNPNDPDPTKGCNTGKTCQPLETAKEAAIKLVDTLYEGYDQVGLVTFDSQAITRMDLTLLTATNKSTIKDTINAINLHDDPSPRRLPGIWTGDANFLRFNPVNPEDRDGDGQDYDDPYMYGTTDPACDPANFAGGPAPWGQTLWDSTVNPYNWSGTVLIGGVEETVTGVPCDRDDAQDVYDWNNNRIFNDQAGDPAHYPDDGTVLTASETDAALGAEWMTQNDPDGPSGPMIASLSPFSTCTGCGLRVASNVFKSKGRPNAVWVMIMLSDGVVNLSDTPQTAGWTSPAPEANYKNGFCQGSLSPDPSDPTVPANNFWKTFCIDKVNTPRACIDTDSATCPLGASTVQSDYSVLDYALDMTDEASLTKSANPNETLGNNIAIYSIFLDSASAAERGEYLMRYMADVGDDGDRDTAPCDGKPSRQSCGQYYYAPNSSQLLPIFENIASRIYTRITQ